MGRMSCRGSVFHCSDMGDNNNGGELMPFIGKLSYDRVNERLRKLTKPFTYVSKRNKIYALPIGFVSDGASIPKLLWSVIGSPFTGKYEKPVWIHDWNYKTQKIKRNLADKIFYEGMVEERVSLWKRQTMWFGVRVGGWVSWRRKK